MNTIIDILKASAWGIFLLILILVISFSAFIAYERSGNFYTNSKILEYKKTYEVINEPLKNLEVYMADMVWTDGWSAYGDKTVNFLTEIIRKRIKENCQHASCYAFYFSTPQSQYDVESYREKLERLIDDKQTSDANNIIIFSLFMAFLTILVSVYLLVALLKFKKLTARGVSVLVILVTPFLIITFGFMTAYVGDYMELVIEQSIINSILLSLASIFVIYPPVIFLCKKSGLNLYNIISLEGFK